MKRWYALCVVLALAGCSGAAGMLPGANSARPAVERSRFAASGSDRKVPVVVTVRVPRRSNAESPFGRHSSTISPETKSVTIAVNGGTASIFNTAPGVCSFPLTAPAGIDTLTIATYSKPAAQGNLLDSGTVVVTVAAGKFTAPRIALGPVVRTTDDANAGSLRYAVAKAQPGDTIWFMLPASSATISLRSPIVFTSAIAIAGPGFAPNAKHDRTVTVEGTGSNRLFVVAPGAFVSIAGLTLSRGVASSNVRVRPYRIVLHPRNRRAPHAACAGPNTFGGGIYSDGTLVVTDVLFDANRAPASCGGMGYGGAIFNDGGGRLEVAGSTFFHNRAGAGGAVYNGGSALFYGDTFAANGGCTATEKACAPSGCNGYGCVTFPYGFGAAILDAGGPGVIVENSRFEGNVAGGSFSDSIGAGGALYLATGYPRITNSSFSANIAGGGADNCSIGAGGAIFEYLPSPGNVRLDGNRFVNNAAGGDAGGYGGAVYDQRATARGRGDAFESNAAYASSSACQPDATAAAGALYAAAGAVLGATTFKKNSATANDTAVAGALYADGALQLDRDAFTSNAASVSGLTDSAGAPSAGGGAIYADNTASPSLSNTTFTGNGVSLGGSNAYYAFGGAVASRDALESNGNAFARNTVAVAPDATHAIATGGAVWSNGALQSRADSFNGNAASGPFLVFGGALYAASAYEISGAAFLFNGATSTSTVPSDCEGGALYLGIAGGSIAKSTLAKNVAGSGTAGGYGGAIALAGGTASFTALTLEANRSSDEGGGIYADGTLSIDRSTFDENAVETADSDSGGGALSVWAPLTLSNSTIAGNSVTLGTTNTASGGGGIWTDAAIVTTGSTISGNRVSGTGHPVTDNGGAGIWSDNALVILNSTISGNVSSVDGGGLAQYRNAAVALQNVTLYQNGAAGNGGNIFNSILSGSMLLVNTIVAGGTAATGNDVENDGTMASLNYNLIGSGVTGHGSFAPSNNDLVGTPSSPIDPKLLPLANNGGPTMTHADVAASPGKGAIPFSAGRCNGVAADGIDQRGFIRGTGGVCDIGAYEFAGTAGAGRVRVPQVRGIPGRRHVHRTAGVPRRPAAPLFPFEL